MSSQSKKVYSLFLARRKVYKKITQKNHSIIILVTICVTKLAPSYYKRLYQIFTDIGRDRDLPTWHQTRSDRWAWMFSSSQDNISALNLDELLGAFRTHYRRYEHLVLEATLNPTDSTVLARLGDEVDEYLTLLIEVCFKRLPLQLNLLICIVAFLHFSCRRAEHNTR